MIALLAIGVSARTLIIPGSSNNITTSNVQFIAKPFELDGPKVYPINKTAYDWWYFDAVAEDGVTSAAVVFYVAGTPTGLPDTVSGTYVTAEFALANGTRIAKLLTANEAVITWPAHGQGASGTWGPEVSFDGAADLSKFKVKFLSSGLAGTFVLRSVSKLKLNLSLE